MTAKRILLVDDDTVTLVAVAKGLERLGFEVTQCSESGRGVELALRGAWDLIVLDLRLPSPLPSRSPFDGLKVVRWIRLSKNQTPVIVFTGSQDSRLEPKAKAAGAIAVVRKTDPPGKLIETIRLALEPMPLEVSPVLVDQPMEAAPQAKPSRFGLLSLGRLFS